MKEYNTRQRALIYDLFKGNPSKSYDADEVYQLLSESGIDKSTVYRNLDRLVNDNLLVRERSEDGTRNLFRYNVTACCVGHLHLVCSKCKGIIHLDEADSDLMGALISSRYGFVVNDSTTVIAGVCKNCSKQ